MLSELPPTFAATREALRAVACFVVAPARKAQQGRIGLQPVGDGFGTPELGGGTRLVVSGDELVWLPDGRRERLTTLRAGAAFAGVELSADPGVGHDLPPYDPDASLDVDAAASRALGAWYAFALRVLHAQRERLTGGAGTASDVNLWPEHFDLAFDWGVDDEARVNLGASPGDAFSAAPYLYVGPWQRERMARDERFWNASFGATLPYPGLVRAPDPEDRAAGFFSDAVDRLGLAG